MTTLRDISFYVQDKIDVASLKAEEYITTDNMLSNREGISVAENLPNANRVTAFKQEDILVSNIRPYFKKIWFADKNGGCSNDVIVFRKNSELVLSKFLFYVLSQDSFFAHMMSGANGTKMPRGNKKTIPDFVVPTFEIRKQEKVASILSAYDDLIETNRKQIKLLEEAAQRLYKEWFVDFRFPGHENVKIVDGVPEGWRVCKIKDLCKRIQSGSTPARKNKEYWDNPEIAWFKTAELQDSWLLDSEEKITQVALDNTSVKLFPKNTVLMAIYASPTLGRLGILDCEATFNQAALGLVAKEGFITTEWLFLKLYELRDEFNSIARGAGQQNISGDIVKNYEVLTPNVEQIQQFTNLVQPFFAKVKVLRIENAKLIEARDRLLPKLMSGEIEVE